ncbi:hypothetical protein [Aureispira anguillae]|uniref:Uncharacterized protein n=1 Tax=Aureispira anguillae TaxID=2864201 RepID=A0A915YH71_9BACT|nr:hypothetical protein [Aureispira anguillae]BDS13108.1 hypothetical protein AsAng_0038360 [Aureispira anguillae]
MNNNEVLDIPKKEVLNIDLGYESLIISFRILAILGANISLSYFLNGYIYSGTPSLVLNSALENPSIYDWFYFLYGWFYFLTSAILLSVFAISNLRAAWFPIKSILSKEDKTIYYKLAIHTVSVSLFLFTFFIGNKILGNYRLNILIALILISPFWVISYYNSRHSKYRFMPFQSFICCLIVSFVIYWISKVSQPQSTSGTLSVLGPALYFLIIIFIYTVWSIVTYTVLRKKLRSVG